MDLKELEKLAKMCRKYGIKSIEDNGLKLSFSDSMPAPRKLQAVDSKETETEQMTEEQVLFWSSAASTGA